MLGERLECEVLRDVWFGIVDLESGKSPEEVFNELQLGSVGVEVVNSHSGGLGVYGRGVCCERESS